MGLFILIVVFAICVIIGTPVAFALGVASVAAFFYEGLYGFLGHQIKAPLNIIGKDRIPSETLMRGISAVHLNMVNL